jgi:predicted PolB exonuclease-like 3'-5' exonuclease
MGMNNEHALRYVFDIETAMLGDAEQYLDPLPPIAPPDLSLITPAKNLVDPAKIAADIEKRQQAALSAYAEACEQQEQKRREQLDRCALDPDLCQIVAIGFQREDWNEPEVWTLQAHLEHELLDTFWRAIGQQVTVGYNTLGFDLQAIVRRSLYLGVQHPFVNLDKYRTNHIDLQQRLSFNGQMKYRPLSFYCKRFGIHSDDETTGKDIAAFVAAGDWAAVARHCRADVLKTKELAERIGLLKQQPVAEGAF